MIYINKKKQSRLLPCVHQTAKYLTTSVQYNRTIRKRQYKQYPTAGYWFQIRKKNNNNNTDSRLHKVIGVFLTTIWSSSLFLLFGMFHKSPTLLSPFE